MISKPRSQKLDRAHFSLSPLNSTAICELFQESYMLESLHGNGENIYFT